MYTQKIVVANQTGLHARPASLFVKTANKFSSKITLHKQDKAVDAKSIIGLLSLGVSKGTEIIITAEGEDEQLAVEALVVLIKGFNE
ncbi:MAG: HPr family phosphocarrier protein [Clostridia bacterium]|jgi:phosphocarrier protein|nr:HPr family phosphocarrier protein [Clostridia bacterium]